MVFVTPTQSYLFKKVCGLTESSTRCLLLEKITETIYQVYKVILRKQDININRIAFLGKWAPYS